MGTDAAEVERSDIALSELIETLRSRVRDQRTAGFTRFNTLAVVNEGEAFTASSDDRVLKDGDEVLLVPFSHGG